MSENYEDDDLVLDKTVDDIINQIKNQSQSIKKVEKEHPTLSKEDLEKFVIENASTVVNDSIDMIQSIKDTLMSCPDPKLIESTAELVKAVTGAIDSLSKLKLSDDKIKSQKEIKQMDIDAKSGMDIPSGTIGLIMSREDLFKELKNLEKIEKKDDAIDV